MSENKGKYPVDEDGDMLEYTNSYDSRLSAWIDMKPFTATLEYKHFTQGRSSVRFIVQDINNGVHYSLMRNSFDSFLQKADKGVLTAEFIVVKRGANYGLLLTEDL